MHHYPHNIGRFNTDTLHMSRLERSVFRDMRDMYFDTEAPLDGSDMDRLAKRLRCRTQEEVDALQFVLSELFTLLPDGRYQNEECEAVIAKYHAQQEEQAVVKDGVNVRQQRSRARRAAIFSALRSLGMVPPAKAKAPELMALCTAHGIVVTDTEVLVNGVPFVPGEGGARHGNVTPAPVTRHADGTAKENQNQNQVIPPNPPAGGASGGFAIATALAGFFPAERRIRLMDVAAEVDRVIAGGEVTAEQLLAAAERQQAMLARDGGKWSPQVLRWVREQRWLDVVAQPAASAPAADWAETRSGVEAMAASLGIPGYEAWVDARVGQCLPRTFPVYEAAVRAALAAQGVPA